MDRMHGEYWSGLGAALRNEFDRLEGKADRTSGTARAWHAPLSAPEGLSSFEDCQRLSSQYRALAMSLGDRLSAQEDIAHDYDSMEEFWEDYALQSKGLSPTTIWDTYEHGRRRAIEHMLQARFAADDAVLVNSGMSALIAAIESRLPTHGSRILSNSKHYFETGEYLETILKSRGCLIEKMDQSQPEEVERAIGRVRPDVVLFETVTNTHIPLVAESIDAVIARHPNVTFIGDNTLFCSQRLWTAESGFPKNLLIAESVTKYLCRQVSAGVIYGSAPLMAEARAMARATGQQLQGRCICYIRPGEIAHIGARMNLHTRNTQIFLNELGGGFGNLSIRFPGRWKSADGPAVDSNVGGLLYLVPAGEGAAPPEFRKLAEAWNARLRNHRIALRVRAGFGWDETTYRIYETSGLNQPDAPNYMRISVGIETEQATQILAAELRRALEETSAVHAA